MCDYFERDKERSKHPEKERAAGGQIGQHAPGLHYERVPLKRADVIWQPDGNRYIK